MDYNLLWSGQVRGMRKARIPAIPATGFLSHDGLAPCRDAIRAALPKRLRPAFARANMSRMKDNYGYGDDIPMRFDLYTTRSRWITSLYLWPLSDG